jgi:hypothetical protein
MRIKPPESTPCAPIIVLYYHFSQKHSQKHFHHHKKIPHHDDDDNNITPLQVSSSSHSTKPKSRHPNIPTKNLNSLQSSQSYSAAQLSVSLYVSLSLSPKDATAKHEWLQKLTNAS